MRLRSILPPTLGLALVFAWGGTALAATLTFGLSFEFSGGSDPDGPTPWVTITLDDSFGGADDVRITIENTNVTGTEFVSGVYLNFDPLLDASLLSFSAVDDSASTPTVTGSNDSYMADGDGFFDILFDFPPPPGNFAAKFTGGESVVFDLTYTNAIDVSSFDFSSVMGGGAGTYQAAAHIQGIDSDPDSGWVGVPEPGTALLLPLGLLGLAAIRRR